MQEKQEAFNNLLNELLAKKTTCIFPRLKYNEILAALEEVNNGGKVIGVVHNWVRRYEVRQIGDEKFLHRREGKRLAAYEGIFEIIHDHHMKLGHAGRDIMFKEVNGKYDNVTREAIKAYLTLCKECALKKGKAHKSVVVQPIISNDMNSRCQVDLIDMQAQADGENKFIMVYQVSRKILSMLPIRPT